MYMPPFMKGINFNPIALRKAKIVHNFGLPECSRVKGMNLLIYLLSVCKCQQNLTNLKLRKGGLGCVQEENDLLAFVH